MRVPRESEDSALDRRSGRAPARGGWLLSRRSRVVEPRGLRLGSLRRRRHEGHAFPFNLNRRDPREGRCRWRVFLKAMFAGLPALVEGIPRDGTGWLMSSVCSNTTIARDGGWSAVGERILSRTPTVLGQSHSALRSIAS